MSGLLLFVQISLFTFGVEYSNSSHTTLLINTYVFWVVVFEHFVTRTHLLNRSKLTGLLIAGAGATLVTLLPVAAGDKQVDPSDQASIVGDLMLLGSGLVLAIKIIYVQQGLKKVPAGTLILWHDLVAVLLFLVASLGWEMHDIELADFTQPAILGLLYQGFVVAGFCFAVQAMLLKKHIASQISIFSFSTPLFGLAAASLLRSDTLSPWLLLSALLVALGTAMGASALGLSLPVGAFLAGLALSGSPYAQQATAELLPLRDAFLAVFFTSVGLLFAPSEIGSGGLLVLAMLAAVLLKGAVSAAVVALGWRSVRVGLMAGVGLAQVGEFSFVLGQEALGLGLIDDAFFQAFLGAAILSMAVTPFATQAARRLYDRDISAPGGGAQQANARAGAPGTDRVLLLGYGQAGRAMARVLDSSGLSFVALDLAVDRVNEGMGDGHDLRFGDASRRATLEAAGGANCRAVVVALGDPWATRAAVRLLRQMNPDVPILARAGNEEEISVLEKLGADEVISTGFESSVHLLATLLERLGVPRHVARVQESILRMDAYGVLRGHAASAQLLPEVDRLLRGGTLVTAEVMQGSGACGSSLASLLLTITGEEMAAVLSLVRDEQPLSNPPASTILEAGDLLVLYGPHAGIDAVLRQLEPPAADGFRNSPAADGPED